MKNGFELCLYENPNKLISPQNSYKSPEFSNNTRLTNFTNLLKILQNNDP